MPACFLTMNRILLYLLLLATCFTACKKGTLLDNVPPDTKISISSINLVGDDRLRSEVELNWLGFDSDGYVTGYELSIDGGLTWNYTTETDSLFQFELSVGQDTLDIDFQVRAIDDKEEVDPTPATLTVPIKNTPPTAVFDTTNVIPDTSHVITTIFLTVEDLDGESNLDSIYLRANNGAWLGLPPSTKIVTLVPVDPSVTGPVAMQVLVGASASLQPTLLTGCVLEGDNQLSLRARDIAGAESAVEDSKVFYIKRKTSDLVLVDAHAGGTSPTPEDVLFPAVAATYSNGFDHIDLRSNNGANRPNLWNPTFSLYLNLYDKVMWYCDESLEGFSILEDASGAVQEFLNNDGKLFVTTGFPTTPTFKRTFNESSVVREFSPIDSIWTRGGLARLSDSSTVYPVPPFSADYDKLESAVFQGNTTPFYVKSTADSMYNAVVIPTGGYAGPNIVCARSQNNASNTNIVFMSLELYKLNGIPGSIESFLNQVLNNEFNW